jgi:hypothetical protein
LLNPFEGKINPTASVSSPLFYLPRYPSQRAAADWRTQPEAKDELSVRRGTSWSRSRGSSRCCYHPRWQRSARPPDAPANLRAAVDSALTDHPTSVRWWTAKNQGGAGAGVKGISLLQSSMRRRERRSSGASGRGGQATLTGSGEEEDERRRQPRERRE